MSTLPLATPPAFLTDDEDVAQEFAAEARLLHAQGVRGRVPLGRSGGVLADISDYAITISVDFMPEYTLSVPLTAEELGAGYYRNWIVGYTHRRDTMVPLAKDLLVDHSGYSNQIAQYDDRQYISEGYISRTHCVFPNGAVLGRPTVMGLSLSIAVEPADLHSNQTGLAGVLPGVKSGGMGYTCMVSPLPGEWEQPPFTSTPYGVVRTGTPSVSVCAGVTRQVDNTVYETDHFKLNQTWYIGYTYVNTIVLMARSFSGSTSGYLFSFGTDIMFQYDRQAGVYYYEDGSLVSAYPVVVIPLGNHSVLVVARQFVADPTYEVFDGKFIMQCWTITGESPLANVASAAGANAAYMNQTEDAGYATYCFAPNYNVYDPNGNTWRLVGYLNELSITARSAVPLGNGTTLVFGRVAPPDFDGAPPQEQLVCSTASTSGLGHRGVLGTYYGWGKQMSNFAYRNPSNTCYKHYFLGACHLGLNTVVAFYRREVVYPYEAYIGVVRFMSEDAGVTWTEQVCTFNFSSDVLFTCPRVVSLRTESAAARLVVGILPREDTGTTIRYSLVHVAVSDDSGASWAEGPVGSVGIELDLLKPAGASNHVTGIGTLMHIGNEDDGFAPSPYANLPTFYGTPSLACRSTANDPNL